MNKLFAREAAGFAIAASVGLGLGLAYKDYATKKYGGDAKALLAEAKALRAAQQPAAAALKMRECLDLVEAKGGAHQRRTEHTAQLARALAATLEEAAEDATRPRRAAYLAEAEAAWTTALEAARLKVEGRHRDPAGLAGAASAARRLPRLNARDGVVQWPRRGGRSSVSRRKRRLSRARPCPHKQHANAAAML